MLLNCCQFNTNPCFVSAQSMSLGHHEGKQAIEFRLDYLVAFADSRFQSRPVQHCDVGTTISNHSPLLQFPCGFPLKRTVANVWCQKIKPAPIRMGLETVRLLTPTAQGEDCTKGQQAGEGNHAPFGQGRDGNRSWHNECLVIEFTSGASFAAKLHSHWIKYCDASSWANQGQIEWVYPVTTWRCVYNSHL